MTDNERLLDQLRPAAFAIAYQMLGTVSEAEDVVQEALLRMHQALDRSFGSPACDAPHRRDRWRARGFRGLAPAARRG
jgi:DNA-directed RNA polymerase specialized sigma24 family protein